MTVSKWESMFLFGTRADLLGLIQELRRLRPDVRIVPWRGYSEIPAFEFVDQVESIEWLGSSSTGSQRGNERLYIFQEGARPVLEEIRLKNGGKRYSLDFGSNRDFVQFFLPGVDSEGNLIIGELIGLREDAASHTLFRDIARLIRQRWAKVAFDWLGPEAYAAFKSGRRLTSDSKLPSIYDVMVPERKLEVLRSLLDQPNA